MKVWKARLTGILICQLLAALVIWGLSLQGQSARSKAAQLTDFESAAVDKIEIWKGDEKLSLLKSAEDWTIPEYYELRADRTKVNSLLSDLEKLSAPGPETRTASSHSRFEVTEEEAQAVIKLYQGEKVVGHLLLGKSPSFGKRFVRLSGENEVYRTNWDGFGVTATGKDWFAKDLWATGKINEISFPTFKLSQKDGKWVHGDESLDQTKVKELIAPLENLRVIEASKLKAPLGFEFTIAKAAGDSHSYVLFKEGQKHYLKRDDSDLVFQIANNVAESLENASLDSLKSEEEEGAESEDSNSGPAPVVNSL